MTTVTYCYQLRRNTADEWSAANPLLRAGEQGYETDTRRLKIGDGALRWLDLPYVVEEPFTTAEKAKLATVAANAAANAVTTVHGRAGDVVGAAGDYTAAWITNVPAGAITAVTVQAALNGLDAALAALAASTLAMGDARQPLDPDLTAVAGLSSTGLIARTAAGTAAARTLTAGSGISVSNGNGVAGNPTISTAVTLALIGDMTAYWRGRAAADPIAAVQSLLAAASTAAAQTALGLTAAGQAMVTAADAAAQGALLAAARDWRGRNRIINSSFALWQRGTSLSAAAAIRFLADRWITAAAGTTIAPSRQSFTLGQTAVPGEPLYYHRAVVASSAGSGNYAILLQRIEGVRTLAGQQVTVSFWAKADASRPIAVDLSQTFGTGGSPSASVDGIGATKVTLTTAWQQVVVTATLPSLSGKTIGGDGNDSLNLSLWFDAGSAFNARTQTLGQQSGTFDIAEVQVEPGGVATVCQRRHPAEELVLCQRYYEKSYDLAIDPGTPGVANGVTAVSETGLVSGVHAGMMAVSFGAQKRVAPTMVFYSPVTGAAGNVYNNVGSADQAISGAAIGQHGGRVWANTGSVTGYDYQTHFTADAEL